MSKQEELSKRKSLLSPAKQALLAKLIRGEQKTEQGVIPRRSQQETALSFAQQRLWFIDQLAPGTPAYNIPVAIRLTGSLDLAVLHQSLNQVVERHEVLRTTFSVVDAEPVQAIIPSLTLPLPTVDLRDIPINEREAEVSKLTTAESLKSFNLTQGPLLRATILQLSDQEHVMVLVIHHIISDGWSQGILIQEMAMLYAAFSQEQVPQLPKLPIQYADFSEWQRNWLQGEVLQTQLDYWKQQLGGDLPILELPTDHPRLLVKTFTGKKHSFVISQPLSQALVAISQQEGATLFMTLLAAFQILLHRYTRQEDICVGSPIANRNRSEIEGLIGFFVNTLVLRTDLGNNPTFKELLQKVRKVTLEAYAHQDLPFEKLVEELQPERNLSHTPLFQVMFVLLNTPMPTVELPDLTLSPVELNTETAIFDLSLFMRETEQGLMGLLEYNSDLFDADTISRMAEHLQNLLQAIAINPEARVSEIPLLSASEQKLLADWNHTQVDYPLDQCVHQLFEAQVEQTPDAVAVVFENEQLTYRQLNEKANQLAHYLRSLGVGADVLVGICVKRSLEMVVGILGILKAGGAYVPLDPGYPQERLAFMIKNAQISVLLTQTNLRNQWADNLLYVVDVDADWQIISQESQQNPIINATANNLAYVIYTSGSTGQPKGVAMTHLPLCNLIHWQLENTTVQMGSKTLQFAPVSFDVSFQEIFSTLCSGRILVLISEELRHDAIALWNFIAQAGIARLFVPFVVLRQLAEAALAFRTPAISLREVITAGEQLQITQSISQWFSQLTDCTLHNHYGPSESHVVTAYTLAHPVQNWPSLPPIGCAIANTQIYILDQYRQQVPVGVAGELYISGICLAQGYLHRPDLTDERFISNPFANSKFDRLYKTGDLARYLPDGNIEYLGRIDHQVKIRGFRIELGEVEAAISYHPEVKETVALAWQDKSGEKRLVSYLVTSDNGSFAISDLRRFLKTQLPEYMIPSTFMLLNTLPLTPSGKVDRHGLPVPDQTRSQLEEAYVAPCNTLELELAQIWEDILNVKPIGVTDNFFDLGGHSLLTVRLITQIQKRLGRELPLSELFQNPTIEYLANILRQQTGSFPKSPLVEIQTAGEKRPFFCVHPAAGNVLCYFDLARCLGNERPFYGLQALETGEQQIEHMASRYVQEIRIIQPEGPYLLGGWSMGGIVAFEMAQQLQQQGQQVELLALFDSYATATNKPTDEDNGAILASFALDIGLSWENRNFAVDEFLQLPLDEQVAFIYEQVKQENLISADVELAEFRHQFDIFRSNAHAMWNYVPQTYPGKVILLQASDRLPETTQVATMCWGQLAQGGVQIQTIPGNHYTIVKKPHVQALAKTLSTYLNLD